MTNLGSIPTYSSAESDTARPLNDHHMAAQSRAVERFTELCLSQFLIAKAQDLDCILIERFFRKDGSTRSLELGTAPPALPGEIGGVPHFQKP